MAYLDNTGLAYFWGKIKAWANSVFALLGHVHPSSDVTSMAGYSMPASTGAISSGDSLNQAVGKLEKAVADNVVHRTGDETVSGHKYFLDYVSSGGGVKARSFSEFIKGTVPDSKLYFWFGAYDDNISNPSYANSCLSLFEVSIDEQNVTNAYIRAVPNVANSSSYTQLTCVCDPTNNSYYVSSNANINLYKYYPSFNCYCNDFVRGTAPSYNFYNFPLAVYDSNKNNTCGIYHQYRSVGNTIDNSISLICYKGDDNTNTFATLGIGYSDKPYAWAVTPDINSNSNYIATTEWVNNKSYVTTNTNQTITGSKLFDSKILGRSGINLFNTRVTKGTTPSATELWSIYFCDKDGGSYADDCMGFIEFYIDNQNKCTCQLRAIANIANSSTTNTNFAVVYSTDESKGYISCPQTLPAYTNTYSLGDSSRKWTAVYATNGTIQTSDERCKDYITSISDEMLDGWESVNWVQFKLKDAIEKKGNKARLHTGVVAQQVKSIFADKSVNVDDYGFFCWDRWDSDPALVDGEGEVVMGAVEAGDQYSIRYDEAFAIEAAYQRRENARLKKRIADLEDRLAALELKIS